MGRGSIYRVGKEFIMYTEDFRQRLPCGCPAMKVVKIIDAQGNKIYQDLNQNEAKAYEGKAEEHISLQGKDCEDFWEKFYKENPSLRPISLNNNL